jgi:leucyl aminopeptidase (aminopeptidase T)
MFSHVSRAHTQTDRHRLWVWVLVNCGAVQNWNTSVNKIHKRKYVLYFPGGIATTKPPGFVKSIVHSCLRVHEEDRVCIFTWAHSLGLAEALALECQSIGAKTHLEVETDKLYYQTVLKLPIKYLKEANPFSLSLLDVSTANIFIQGPEDPEGLKKITPERMSAIVQGDKPYSQKFLEKKIRTAQIYLGYVTQQRAETYGFDYEKWNANIRAAMDVDYSEMRELGMKTAKMLENASVIQITANNGTDLKLELAKRAARIDDGVIDDEDICSGYVFTALPAGTVAMLPKERSAEGVFISDIPEADTGLLIHGMSWKFKNGRLTSFTGSKNVDAIKKRWEIAKGEKDQASWLKIGLNPNAQGGYIHNDIVLGSVSLGIGDNREMDGKVESDFGARCTILHPSVKLDGRLIIKNGRFVA